MLNLEEGRIIIKMKGEYILFGLFLISLIGIGYGLGMKETKSDKLFNGLRFEDTDNYGKAMQIAHDTEGTGDWVCINIKDMDYKQAVKTCQHEVGHEIFAKECEKDIDKCMEAVK
jgi:hypothetical protein